MSKKEETKFADEVAEMSFEEAMDRLEALVGELEQGGIDLDRSIEIYEQAVILRDRCRAILDDSERRIKKIMETADGLKEEDFERSRGPRPRIPPICGCPRTAPSSRRRTSHRTSSAPTR
jgi:exodeoxyribonuclease VII small subunit